MYIIHKNFCMSSKNFNDVQAVYDNKLKDFYAKTSIIKKIKNNIDKLFSSNIFDTLITRAFATLDGIFCNSGKDNTQKVHQKLLYQL